MTADHRDSLNTLVSYANAVCAGATLFLINDTFAQPTVIFIDQTVLGLVAYALPANVFSWLIGRRINWGAEPAIMDRILRAHASLSIIVVIFLLGLWFFRYSPTVSIIYAVSILLCLGLLKRIFRPAGR